MILARWRIRLWLALALLGLVWAESGQLRWVGELHSVVGLGQDEARIQLASLRPLSHLYGLGPAAGRDGEITVFDSQLSFARMDQGVPHVSADWQVGAAFLVYVQVAEWQEQASLQVDSLADLDRQLLPLAGEKPMAFRLTGRVEVADLHIIDRRGRPALGHEANRKLRATFQLKDEIVECFGVYSLHHQGILTHHGSNLHLHVRNQSGDLSGHLDELRLAQARLWLPK